MVRIIKSCTVYIRHDSVFALPMRYFHGGYGMAASPPIFKTSLSASYEEVGKIVLLALDESKEGVPDNLRIELSEVLFDVAGFRSIDSFRKKSLTFSVSYDKGMISIIPGVGDRYPYALARDCAATAEDIGRLLLEQVSFLSDDSSEARLLRLAKFYVRHKGTNREEAWEALKVEGFSIDVPVGKELKIRIYSPDEYVDLSPLEALKSKELHALDLHMTKLRDSDLEYLRCLRALKVLDLDSADVTDKGLKHLEPLSQLRSLNLTFNSDIGNTGLAFLKRLPSLEVLILRGTKANDEGLVHLLDMPALKRLNLNGLNITGYGLAQICKLTSLEVLDIGSTKIRNSDLEYMASLPSLQSLSLEETNIGNAGLRYLQCHKQIQELNLLKTKITNSGLSYLKEFTHLGKLNLAENNDIGDSGLKRVGAISSLQDLNMSYTNIGDKGLAHLRKLPSLKRLNLRGTRITDAGLDHLKHITSVEELDLINTRITYLGLEKVREIRSLKMLSAGIYGTDIFLRRSLGEARWLDKLSKSVFSSYRVEPLKRATSLKKLVLYFPGVTPEEESDLKRALPDCEVIVHTGTLT